MREAAFGRRDRARALLDVTSSLLRAHTPVQVTAVFLKQGLPAIEAAAGALVTTAWEERLVLIEGATGFPEALLERWRQFSLDDDLPLQVALRENRAIWLADAAARRRAFPAWPENSEFAYPSVAVIPLTARDRPLGALALCFAEPGARSDEERTFATLLAQQVAQALERARLYEAERAARVKAEFAERRIAFLADASERLSASLDPRITLASVARLIVPEFADWVVLRATWANHPDVLAVEHRDPALAARLRAWEERNPPAPGDATGPARARHEGRPELIEELDPADRVAHARDEAHADLLRSLRTRSRIAVPVRVRDRILGSVVLGASAVGRRYTQADLSLAEDLAARMAHAIDNAQLYDSALSASEAKSNFLAVMSHELRTPLNAVLGYADLILMNVPEPIGDRTRHQVERMRDAAGRLLRLVEEVLRFARLEANSEAVAIEIAPIAEVVGDSIALVEPMALARGIELRVDIPDPELQLETDAWKLRHVVSNLLTNAVKFTDEGSVSLEVRRRGDEVHITVADTGIGIAPEHLEHIFDPFWQAEQSATRRFEGTGLGLGVARELTRLIGGEIQVESRLGRGTTFLVTLPIHFAGAGSG